MVHHTDNHNVYEKIAEDLDVTIYDLLKACDRLNNAQSLADLNLGLLFNKNRKVELEVAIGDNIY